MSWGHATSKDLVSWEDVGGWQDTEPVALGPGPAGSYNSLGIWTGTGQPVNLHGESDGTLSVVYTSISALPIGRDIPYANDSETWSIATSTDAGRTWKNHPDNPVVHAPESWNITGWRDPFLLPLPELDSVLKKTEPYYYVVLGSGIREVGPRMPLYSAPQSDLTNWTFLGALWEPIKNTSLGSFIETGTYGYSFECSNFFPLEDSKGKLHWYVNMGAETDHGSKAMWTEGIVSSRANGSAEFTPLAGGRADWGVGYATTSFVDTKNDSRRVQWVWVLEALNNFGLRQQGYQGAMALPRQLFVHETTNVVNPPGGMGNSRYVEESEGMYTAYTLGVKPLPEIVDAIREPATYKFYGHGWHDDCIEGSSHMSLTITLSKVTGGTAGVYIAQSPDGKECTAIYYSPGNNTIQVDRSKSSLLNPHIRFEPAFGYFKPHQTRSGEEAITMTIFLDGSLLEVYANDRFALSTRIYPARNDSTRFGLYLGDGAKADFSDFSSWIGLKNVWPKRPTNSSSALIFDTEEQTGNHTWWGGLKI